MRLLGSRRFIPRLVSYIGKQERVALKNGKKISKYAFPSPTLPLPNREPKVSNTQLISPWIWALFVASLLISAIAIFIAVERPTLLPWQDMNPWVLRPLPEMFQIPFNFENLVVPVASVIVICIGLLWIPPNNISRLIFRSILAIFAIRYLVWRTLFTVNSTHWISLVFSLILLVNEIVWIGSYLLYLLQTTWTTEEKRKREADLYEKDVKSGNYLPSVDVFVPTYKEPEFIVRRTVIGCQAMNYPNKKIYILDDTRRPHIKALAEELGCEYFTRPDNSHAKAGNLNNALPQTQGELISIMDADFVPFTNFLSRTVGFFQNPRYDMVQTPQFFYNPDYHARNLGLQNVMPNDMEHFFGHVQPGRDSGNCVICCGTSYVVRRSSLEAIGGYYTGCCVEDYQTSIRMLTNGARLVYLNELLSMGESTRMFSDFLDQRLRWLQGNMQVYFRKDLQIWTKLNLVQKSYHVSLILFCFNPVIRLISLLTPLLSLWLGISPLICSMEEYFYYAAPFAILFLAVFGWSNDGRLSAFWNEVYETTFCFPALQRLWLILRNPFAKASTATRKGVKADRKNYNFQHTYPLIILMLLTMVGLGLQYGGYLSGIWPRYQYEYEGKTVLLLWLLYNLVVMSLSILSAIDQPVRREVDRFPLATFCKLTIGDRSYWGYTNDLSEAGASLTLNKNNTLQYIERNQEGVLEFLEHNFTLPVTVMRSAADQTHGFISLKFNDVNLEQSRKLITMLYCSLEWWKLPKRPSGLDAILTGIAAALQCKPLLNVHKNGV